MQDPIIKEISSQSRPLRIEVCGGIASGKTSIATLMNRIGIKSVFENFKINPFWEAFYSDPISYAFETEITFLLQHYHQIKTELSNEKMSICDFSFLLDLAYAEIGLQGTKLKTFLTVYNEIKLELPAPVLIIHLNCDAKTELERIYNRGRIEEKKININFLKNLNRVIDQKIRDVSKEINIISINSTQKNFVNDESVKQEIINLVIRSLPKFAYKNS